MGKLLESIAASLPDWVDPARAAARKLNDRSKYITEGPNVGVSRTADVVKKSAKKAPVKVTKKEVTVEAPASDLGNIGSVDRTNPEVIGADMGTYKPAPVEERSLNAPSSRVDKSTWEDPMVQARRVMTGGMKKGGSAKCMASGGSVKSSASSRGDGIALRGKTKGRMC